VLLREPLKPTRPALDQPMVALHVGDGDLRVVERGQNVGDARSDVFRVLGLDDLFGVGVFAQKFRRRRRGDNRPALRAGVSASRRSSAAFLAGFSSPRLRSGFRLRFFFRSGFFFNFFSHKKIN
jgi:hypothetical protein